ncbi:MAG: class I SAM-dependent methyltransferase [Phycisphaerae bacterium]|nr:class I SAM-dependent methyltransferase [Phycisphaerae bacterium]
MSDSSQANRHGLLAADPVLERHRAIWEQRPLLRQIYTDLYERMAAWLAEGCGPTIELGAGPGSFKTFCPAALSSDVSWCPWLDLVADAAGLPFSDGGVGNLVLFDVLHHMPRPARVLAEAQRVLAPGGRMILCEPYVSWVSWPAYRFLHGELTDCRVQPLAGDPDKPVFEPGSPWSANQAIPTILFWRDQVQLAARFPHLTIRHRQALSTFLYPLSGGFEKPCLLPRFTWPLARVIERCTGPLARWIGWRCLVVLQRSPG